jgi:dTMP kinase
MVEKTYFISFEGIDGSGKDTQLFALAQAIKEDDNYPFGNKYSNIWITRNPTKITPSGVEISELIRSQDVDGKTASRLYIKDRIEHTQYIKEVLKHSHVLTSRYDVSTLTYQLAQGEDFDELYEMHNFEEEIGCIFPNVTVVFEIPAEVSFERISSRGEQTECFEKLDFQKKLVASQKYCVERLLEKGRKIILVNSNQSIEKVTKEMLEKLDQILL